MREIKFRYFDKREKKMYYGVEQTYDWENMPTSKGEDDYYALTQYTGLKDKNGKEVYEGDVLKKIIDGNEWTFKVFFGSGSFVFQGITGPLSGYFTHTPSTEFEVIGNIHENPELLK